MSTGGAAIRGSRVGAGPMGEQDRGFKAERFTVNYYCSAGHSYSPQYALAVDLSDIPEIIDCPNCGLPAGQDKANPPVIAKHEPYKTHLAYVKERRTLKEAKELLDEAVAAEREDVFQPRERLPQRGLGRGLLLQQHLLLFVLFA